MKIRRWLALFSAFGLLLGMVQPAAAGGWATIELESPLAGVVAGEEVEVRFVILQHGISPARYERVQLTATQAESEETIAVLADAGAAIGHYRARVAFPEPGRWNLDVEVLDFGIRSSFPTLRVLEPNAGTEDVITVTATIEATIPGRLVEVEIINTGFAPALIDIEAGTTVRWTNQDPIKHEIAFADLLIDDSGIISEGETFFYTFDTPGEYTFACGPHPGMSGTVVVR